MKLGEFTAEFHSANAASFLKFLEGSGYLCGHNLLAFDLKILKHSTGRDYAKLSNPIDTLLLSPLLFPDRRSHRLLKDEKLGTYELNNPLSDAKKAKELLQDELDAFRALPEPRRQIFHKLLCGVPGFAAFFKRELSLGKLKPQGGNLAELIQEEFAGEFCAHANLQGIIDETPTELAYALSFIGSGNAGAALSPWVLKSFPKTGRVMRLLCGTNCNACAYCQKTFDLEAALARHFGHKEFRKYGGEPLQESAVRAAVEGRSLLAIFPTGGGKSITFQLPALLAGESLHALTVVISPLQSLMKDQVDGLQKKGIASAVTVNGLLDPLERSKALKLVESGEANLLYLSPETLRSRTIRHLLSNRQIARFVIDEAHCFSAWGQDFRVDYLYIARFIKKLEAEKGGESIPVSCFTATAKPKVVTDICEYFKRELDLDLEKFATSATRENLHYKVLYRDSDEAKYETLRDLVSRRAVPTIVYVSRTSRAESIAERLRKDSFPAKAFHGQMEAEEKIAHQNAFIEGETRIIVATSAFGMGIDKENVGLVVHYDISSSLENYLQESGRAGRNQALEAECIVLFNEADLDDNFNLLAQTKLSFAEIQQVWKAIKNLTKGSDKLTITPLELAREAGWDKGERQMETSLKAAVNALESSGYVKREENSPKVYATAIRAVTYEEAAKKVDASEEFSEEEREHSKRILKSLISERSVKAAQGEDAESRVDYLADMLSIPKEAAIDCIEKMRLAKILDNSLDMKAYIFESDTERKSKNLLEKFTKLEAMLLESYKPEFGDTCELSLKKLNEQAAEMNLKSSERDLRTLLIFHVQNGYVTRRDSFFQKLELVKPKLDLEILRNRQRLRAGLATFFLEKLFEKCAALKPDERGRKPVEFSLVGLFTAFQESMFGAASGATLPDAKEALLYLSKIGALKIDGGFLVLRNAMQITRRELRNQIKYKQEDYAALNEYYKQKIQQVHIVGEYARLMVRDYGVAMAFAKDYFQLEYGAFITRYFKGERLRQLSLNLTPAQMERLYGKLSARQRAIIEDKESKYIAVAAGPGSGKTMTLVHKLASLLALEDVKAENLLMLTFSRAAATEFKTRLLELAGNVAFFVQIKTFHSYSFDLLGRIGDIETSGNVVKQAAEAIKNGEVEPTKLFKSVLVLDEAQDMSADEFELVRALMAQNEEMRVIAVGDDDQNIYGFRGSSSEYFKFFANEADATLYEMTENYRSKAGIVAFANEFAGTLKDRMKTEPISAVKTEAGKVKLTKHTSGFMAEAVVNEIGKPARNETLACLTGTNEEAYQVFKLLTERGVAAKLIQTSDAFKLYDLAELRFFLKRLEKHAEAEKISNEAWKKSLADLTAKYAESECLELCRTLLETFKASHTKRRSSESFGSEATFMYKSDLEEFIRDSKHEDFCKAETGVVHVSTIHKAKGREFDKVCLLLSKFHLENSVKRAQTEAAKADLKGQHDRAVYVALTRARSELSVHTDADTFDSFKTPGLEKAFDGSRYERPREILLRLGYDDVNLGFFEGKAEQIFKLRSGEELGIEIKQFKDKLSGKFFRFQNLKEESGTEIVRFSKKFHADLDRWEAKGYKPARAKVGYVVAWFSGEGETAQEIPVVLPDLYLRRG